MTGLVNPQTGMTFQVRDKPIGKKRVKLQVLAELSAKRNGNASGAEVLSAKHSGYAQDADPSVGAQTSPKLHWPACSSLIPPCM